MIKLILKIIWKLKKILIFLIFLLSAGFYGYSYWHNLALQNTAIKECQDLYKSNINRFAEQTGITGLNVDFKEPPTIQQAKNIYTVSWNNTIDVAGDLDSFKCQFNFSTNKALDRSSNIDISN